MLASIARGCLFARVEQELRLIADKPEALIAGARLGGEWPNCGPMGGTRRRHAGRRPATSEEGGGEKLRGQPDLVRCQLLGSATISLEIASPQRRRGQPEGRKSIARVHDAAARGRSGGWLSPMPAL